MAEPPREADRRPPDGPGVRREVHRAAATRAATRSTTSSSVSSVVSTSTASGAWWVLIGVALVASAELLGELVDAETVSLGVTPA